MPKEETMYKALLRSDSSYEGIFFVGVKTTGIFCRPTCTARKPKKDNVEFFPSTKDALEKGYRPCKKCSPLSYRGEFPEWLRPVMDELRADPTMKIRDAELRERGVDPNRARRWFKKAHGMTFQGYLRTLRVSDAFGRIRFGESVLDAAMDAGYESLSGFTETFKKTTGFPPSDCRKKTLLPVTRLLTPLGPMLAAATEKGICLLEFIDRRMIETQLKRAGKLFDAELAPGRSKFFDVLNRELTEYFAGSRKEFSVPLDNAGTPFQVRVWNALRKIPYGSTRSYKEQAEMLRIPTAVRAVARANGDNRIAIIIPCHRVIGSDGKLVGYGGGLWRKKFLLNLESKNSRHGRTDP
jgi:AraC family transcriptional regulator of adaptative response/methylated-DNA-[protein]-cysteine methyltransferase